MAELKDGVETFHARTQKEWRKWLQKNHKAESGVQLIIYKKESDVPSVYYAEAVEEALCFGWIDSRANKKDNESYYLFFGKRKPKSKWSKINKERVEKLLKQKRMAKAGLATIQIAKENGTWIALEHVEKTTIPPDLHNALNKNKTAHKNFLSFPRSSKKMILEWIQNAKKEETRAKRIAETVTLAARNVRAHHPVK